MDNGNNKDYPVRKNRAKGSITISTTICPELWVLAQKHGISWAEALRIGVTQLLSENTNTDYQNPGKFQKTIDKLQEKIQEIYLEKENLQSKLDKFN